jgi:hypothetical protein
MRILIGGPAGISVTKAPKIRLEKTAGWQPILIVCGTVVAAIWCLKTESDHILSESSLSVLSATKTSA